ncbi:MAG: hypothetical protein NTZ35_17840 [Ignavibacteriales bacterium]|nr:hypothetical protein [Ignavibacteriales bacterium]
MALLQKPNGLLSMNPNPTIAMTLVSLLMLISSCSRSNNLLLGRVEAKLGTHTVIVTDCYQTSVPPTQAGKDSTDGSTFYHFTPCLDADVVIRNEWLMVNRRAYERLSPGDTVIVDHGQVLVNTHLAQSAPETP